MALNPFLKSPGTLFGLGILILSSAPAGATVVPPLEADSVLPGHQTRGRTQSWWQTPKAAAEAWKDFESRFGTGFRARWDLRTGVPQRIFGPGIEAPGAIENPDLAAEFSQQWIGEMLPLLAPGADATDFELISNDLDRGLRTVAWGQHRAGLAVLGGAISFRFKNDRLVGIASTARPHVPLPATVVPLFDSTIARVNAAGWLKGELNGSTMTGDSTDDPVILPRLGVSGLRYHVVVPVHVLGASPVDRWTVFLDASSAEPISFHPEFMTGSGSLSFDIPERWPGGLRHVVAAPEINVTVNGNDQNSDPQGVVAWNGTAPATVTLEAEGQSVRIFNTTGPQARQTIVLNDGGSYVWDASNDEFVDGQLTTYVTGVRSQDRARFIAPGLAWLFDETLEAYVNLDTLGGDPFVCNAASDGTDIYFAASFQNCANTARLPDVVAHEFGHSFHFHAVIPGAGAWEAALSEGGADFFAASLLDDPALAPGFSGTPDPLRHLDPVSREYVWPDDVSQDPHITGLIFGGAMWDLRRELIRFYGYEPGVDHVDWLLYQIFRRAEDIPSSYVEALIADDDDGNLVNGTPNKCWIDGAFAAHGLADPVESPILFPDPVIDGNTIEISDQTARCVFSLTSVAMTWRLQGTSGTGTTVVLEHEEDKFVAPWPEVPIGSVIEYQLSVGLETGFQGTLPLNPASPWFEFLPGDLETVFCTDFETDPEADGWTHVLAAGTAGEGADDWQWGASTGVIGSSDPVGAFSGTAVVGNDLGGEGFNGRYQAEKTNALISPPLSLADLPDDTRSLHLHYRRWLSVEDGQYDSARVLVNDTEVWRNASGDGTLHHQDQTWRLHTLNVTELLVDQPTATLRFELQSDAGLEFGGWTLDDVCIVALVGPEGTPIPEPPPDPTDPPPDDPNDPNAPPEPPLPEPPGAEPADDGPPTAGASLRSGATATGDLGCAATQASVIQAWAMLLWGGNFRRRRRSGVRRTRPKS